jgi:hypothetical protein
MLSITLQYQSGFTPSCRGRASPRGDAVLDLNLKHSMEDYLSGIKKPLTAQSGSCR